MVLEQFTPIGACDGPADSQRAPVNDDRSSLVYERGHLVTPSDELTGLPYPIIIHDENLPTHRYDQADSHHAFHPWYKLRSRGAGATALRNCRIELVDTRHHNQGKGSYHAFYDGPIIPTDPIEQFKTGVYACAGYIPDYGIDMSSGEPEIVEITSRQRAILRTPSDEDEFGYRYLTYRYDPLRKFFAEIALQQDFSVMDDLKLEEFLQTKDESRKQHLSRWLIAQATERAAESIEADFREAHAEGRLHPAMQANPSVLVFFKIGNRETQQALLPKVEQKVLETVAA